VSDATRDKDKGNRPSALSKELESELDNWDREFDSVFDQVAATGGNTLADDPLQTELAENPAAPRVSAGDLDLGVLGHWNPEVDESVEAEKRAAARAQRAISERETFDENLSEFEADTAAEGTRLPTTAAEATAVARPVHYVTPVDEQWPTQPGRARRLTPAVVRRGPVEVFTPPGEAQTAVVTAGELEARMREAAQEFMAEPAPVFLEADESFYDDVEVGERRSTSVSPVADFVEAAPVVVAAEPGSRRIAHTVRRKGSTLSPPIVEAAGPVIVMEAVDDEVEIETVAPQTAPFAADDLEALLRADAAEPHLEQPPPPRAATQLVDDAEVLESVAVPVPTDDGDDDAREPMIALDADDGDEVEVEAEEPAAVVAAKSQLVVESDVVPVPFRVRRPTSVPSMANAQLLASPVVPEEQPGDAQGPLLDLGAMSLRDGASPDDRTGESRRWLALCERELEGGSDPGLQAGLHLEAARHAERLGEDDRARGHYESVLISEPTWSEAIRGLRRIAGRGGDVVERARQIEKELEVCAEREKEPLQLLRIDTLMAGGESDLARVAVGELLDETPASVRALLASAELAFVDGRHAEFASSLAKLADVIQDRRLGAVAAVVLAQVAEHAGDQAAALGHYQQGLEHDPGSGAAVLGAWRTSVPGEASAGVKAGLLGLAHASATTPATAAALALRLSATAPGGDTAALELAWELAGNDPVVAVAAAEATATDSPRRASAYAALARGADRLAAREHALVIAAASASDAATAASLWEACLQLDPANHLAAVQLRGLYQATGHIDEVIALDETLAQDNAAARARLGIRLNQLDRGEDAVIALKSSLGEEPFAQTIGSLAMIEELVSLWAAEGQWYERARLLARLADVDSELVDKPYALRRALRAWQDAHAADAAASASGLTRAASALLAYDPSDREAQQSVFLAGGASPQTILAALARAREVEGDAARLGLLAARQARQILLTGGDVAAAEAVVREAGNGPAREAAAASVAIHTGRVEELAIALDDLAQTSAEESAGAAVARFRAAQLWMHGADAPARAVQSLSHLVEHRPSFAAAHDLLSSARRRLGESGSFKLGARAEPGGVGDAFARLVREAEGLAVQGDGSGALHTLSRALELRPGTPLARDPLMRIAERFGDGGILATAALGDLKIAEDSGDAIARADAYERLADLDARARGDRSSAMMSWEAALEADPRRLSVLREIARDHASADRFAELARLRALEVQAADSKGDVAALGFDQWSMAEKSGASEADLRALLRRVVEADSRHRLALFHLEMIARRHGASLELAECELAVAALFANDPRSQAAFLTRAGETLADIGEVDRAISHLKIAVDDLPGYLPALQTWQRAALRGQLWLDCAEACIREAAATPDDPRRASLYHLAGVILMDKSLLGERAIIPLRNALHVMPDHRDAFVRLRILLEEEAKHEDLASVLESRLDVEPDPGQRVALHRAVAELHRNFLDDRETAKHHYRAIIEANPTDLRAIAALSDVCWEQGQWAEASDALLLRARLETDKATLKNLFYRIGLIYAERLDDPALALKAFQRVLAIDPVDENALDKTATLAVATGDWKMALAASERLLRDEKGPDRRVQLLHRVAFIFARGMGDRVRAERALNMALDQAPANDDALAQVVRFYEEARDTVSLRVHLNRVIGIMRTRLGSNGRDTIAAEVLSRAMLARERAGVVGSVGIARCAAELALLTGGNDEREVALAATALRPPSLSQLVSGDAAEQLFPSAVTPEVRQLFALLGDRLAKHIGSDLRPYGLTRNDKLRPSDETAVIAHGIAAAFGMGEIDVFVSTRQPWAMAVEPTGTLSLILGSEVVRDPAGARFAAAGALRLAQAHMHVLMRMPADEMAVLLVALLRLFQADFAAFDVNAEAVLSQQQRLRRLIPTNLLTELRPFGLAIDAAHFDRREFAQGVLATAHRAGLVAGQSLASGLRVIAGRQGISAMDCLATPEGRALVAFAFSEDHTSLLS
jgi:tetratricopeptide (TPR) repeat protein